MQHSFIESLLASVPGYSGLEHRLGRCGHKVSAESLSFMFTDMENTCRILRSHVNEQAKSLL